MAPLWQADEFAACLPADFRKLPLGPAVVVTGQQPGFLGVESARETLGITVSYWESLESIANWKANGEHQLAQQAGRDSWYVRYHTRIARVERDYRHDADR